MPKLRVAQTAATLVGALLAAGCSGEARTAGDSAAPTTESSSATPSSPTSSASPSTQPAGEGSNCLFTDTQVSGVLGGTWERDPLAPGDPCEYSSDRGPDFVTFNVDEPIEPGLRVARRQCLAGVKPISIADGGFVCVERNGSDRFVIGTVGVRGRVWLLVMSPEPEGTHKRELSAMVALARAAPK